MTIRLPLGLEDPQLVGHVLQIEDLVVVLWRHHECYVVLFLYLYRPVGPFWIG
jgi:hypothetical protein